MLANEFLKSVAPLALLAPLCLTGCPQSPVQQRESALRDAAFNGKWDAVDMLLRFGTDPNAANWTGNTPLTLALNGARFYDPEQGQTPRVLHNILMLLLCNGADPYPEGRLKYVAELSIRMKTVASDAWQEFEEYPSEENPHCVPYRDLEPSSAPSL